MVRRQSSATWLLLAYLALVVYASLYPFWPWTWPPGMALPDLIGLPWPRYFGTFDMQANVLGYLPLGLLSFAAALRSGWGLRGSLALGLLLAPVLSFVMESLQYFLPGRVPSSLDWLLNVGGAWAGVALGAVLHAFGGLRRWHDLSEYWFQPHSAGALALLALWPVGLLFPTAVPLGLGQWLPRLQNLAVSLLADTPWAVQWADDTDVALDMARALPPGLEALVIALGLLSPILLALAVARPGWRRLVLVFGALALGMFVTALSTAMNFGPQHMWAWLTLATWPGLALAMVLALLAMLLPRRLCAALGLVVMCALIGLISQAPTSPYLHLSQQAWEQGRFINLYGLAQWIGWVWPFAAIAWLLTLIGRRVV
nr:VanZ family protein [uncultured Roseateles sp.]